MRITIVYTYCIIAGLPGLLRIESNTNCAFKYSNSVVAIRYRIRTYVENDIRATNRVFELYY